MKHTTREIHTYELTAEDITDAIVEYVLRKQKVANFHKDEKLNLAAFPTREVIIMRDESPERTIVGAVVKFSP